MRVLVINPGGDVYGSDLQMLESVTALAQAGCEVRVALAEAGPLQQRLENVGADTRVMRFPVIRRAYLSPLGMIRLGLEVLQSAPTLAASLRSIQPDVVYVNTTTIPWWIVASRLSRVPVLCHVHEAEDTDPGPVRRLMAAPLGAADRVLFISRTAERAALEVLPRLRRRSVVILNGVPDRPDAPVPPPAGHHPRLGFVSRLSERKAQHVAIAAVDILRRRGRMVELELAGTVYPGNEAYEERLHREVRDRGLEGLVTFSGYVTPSSAVFDRSNIALSLSVRDALGNVVVEAQLAERPVIAAGVGGHLESIVDGETGLHVRPDDPDSVADAVESLLADPARSRQIALAGSKSARALFGVQRYGDRVVALVRELAVERPRRR